MLRRNAFSARIRFLAPSTPVRNQLYKPRQVDVDGAIEAIASSEAKDAPAYSDLMLGHIAMRRRQAMADGWAHFHAGDYVRALASFESAGVVAPDDPAAAFGQFMAVAADRQHRRALHKLIRLARLDRSRLVGGAGMFKFDFSLSDAFVSADALEEMLDELREFARRNPDSPQAQGLHCFLLWYAGTHDARLEARSIAARIQRTHPETPWARFHDMIQAADRDDTTERNPS